MDDFDGFTAFCAAFIFAFAMICMIVLENGASA